MTTKLKKIIICVNVMLIYVNNRKKLKKKNYVNFMLIYVNIIDRRTDRHTDKHIKSIVPNLTKLI